MSKRKCDNCGNMAVWLYMPGSSSSCEDHVPRGCSCNRKLKEGLEDENLKSGPSPDSDYEQATDAEGRVLPCCEWWCYPNGIEEGVSKVDLFTERYELALKEGRT